MLTQINGRPVKTGDEVQQAVEGSQVGSQIQLGLTRNGQTITVPVKTGQLATQPQEEQPTDGG